MAVPVPTTGQDARVYAAQVVAAMRRANMRLKDDAAFYEAVVRDFSTPTPAETE